MKPIKPGESRTISFEFILDKIRKRIEDEYDETIVIEYELPDPRLYPFKMKHKIVLALDPGVDEK